MLQNRPPIVVILGHVDHGKTTLLDYLRQTNIAGREPGGITQHTRSFQLTTKDQQLLTFIDTPGHAAFASMRQRGSKIADLALLVVAADDGVMPQTKESVEFIQSSGIPFIVVITKIDLATADPDRIKTQLTESNIIVEDLGGQVPVVSVSAKTGKGIPDLLDMISLISSLNPPQADPEGQLESIVLESRLDSKKGPLAVSIIKNGRLTVGTELFQDRPVGKARAIIGSDSQNLTSALPSQPVEILGLSLVPEVGSVLSDHLVSDGSALKSPAIPAIKSPTSQNLIVKADVAGSLEAILSVLSAEFNVLFSGTGNLVENDILLARTSNAVVVGFNLKLPGGLQKLAETEGVTVKTFNIIYDLLTYLDDLVHPKQTATIVGKAEVLADFKINSDRIAGCRCTEGFFDKTVKVTLRRGETLVGETRIKSLHQGKKIIEKVKLNTEFGAVFSPYVDFKVGDNIIATTG